MIDRTTEQAGKHNPNPKGKGGFKDHPELINAGGRPKNVQRYDYWLQFFKDMDVEKFRAYSKSKPEGQMYVAEIQAYSRIAESLKDLKTWQIVADRTEGRSKETHDITTNGESINVKKLSDEEINERIKQYLERNKSS